MTPSVKLSYVCTRDSFLPVSAEGVRWLAPKADYYRYEQMLLTRGVEPPEYGAWLEWHEQGYGFAAYVQRGTVLSVAAVLRQPEGDWQLAGVRTLDAHAGHGYATAVSSFVTNYIVHERGAAACELADEDAAMRHILEKLGYRHVEEPGESGETGG
jgi:RimJ/RimL family protein N-acetyltransferase